MTKYCFHSSPLQSMLNLIKMEEGFETGHLVLQIII